MRQFASRFGVTDMIRSGRMPNTRRALAAAEYARDQGKIDTFRKLTMDAHWKEGRDIEAPAVLRDLAAASGMDPDRTILASEDPVYLGRVDAIRIEYKRVKTGGIPTFVLGEEVVEGCQPYEVLAEAARRSGATPR
jgi:predicted DsbA family dithiol-disulfide isomerase